jgi:DNA polymerase (family 10)
MVTKRHIARVLSDIAFYLRLNEANPYKAVAYERAARALLLSPYESHELLEEGVLTGIAGIGPSTASVIRELLLTDHSNLLHRVRGSYPESLVELGRVPRLRPKQIRRLYEEGGIRSIADLQVACRNNQLLSIKGIGPKFQSTVERALGEFRRGEGYRLYANVLDEASSLEECLAAIRGVKRVSTAGALRRKMEVINAFHFVVSWPEGQEEAAFLKGVRTIPNVTDAAISDARRVTALSPTGLPMAITLARPSDYDFHLLLDTGSDEHLGELLRRFAANGLPTWNDIRRHVTGLDERAIYHSAGLPFVPPTIREGRGEFEYTASTLQRLVEPNEIQGFFHFHTNYSDGSGTLDEMVVAAHDRGYRYLGISDHSQSAFYANGLTVPRIYEQWKEIASIQQHHPTIQIFKGIEADILPDGTMDYPDELLSQFDFVIASVHSRFNLSEADQTRRICRALANPYVTMLAHPTGRLLLSRPGYRFDVAQVIETARQYGKILEINGSRHRLDLDWRYVRAGKAEGLKFSVNPDAHAVDELDNIALAVNVAQKGGLVADDIVNTQPLSVMKTFLREAHGSSTDRTWRA